MWALAPAARLLSKRSLRQQADLGLIRRATSHAGLTSRGLEPELKGLVRLFAQRRVASIITLRAADRPSELTGCAADEGSGGVNSSDASG